MRFRIITDASAIDFKQWAQFVQAHPQGNIFQTPQMYSVYDTTNKYKPIVVACYENGNIVGVLLAVIQKEYEGILGKLSARSIIWAGPLVRDSDSRILELLLKEYGRTIKKQAIYTQIRNIYPMDWAKEVIKKVGYKMEDHLDILINLDDPLDVLWKKMHPSRRKQIDRGYRRGVEFSFVHKPDEATLTECYELLACLYKKIKLPFPSKEFYLNSYFHLNDKIGLFVLTYQKRIIGCRFVFLYKKMIYDWYAGSDDGFLDKYPNDILPWEVIKWGANNEYAVFDFGGAGKPGVPYGVRDFKLKFGGNVVNYGRFRKIHNPLIYFPAVLGFWFWKVMKRS
jgi:lipid II:glycine glycyltransferase (peptidoglycan interpeptide bridge formation enzyme)